MELQLIDLQKQYEAIKNDVEKNIIEVLSSARYIMGDNVKCFENEFCEYLGVKHAISVGNGTDALVIALKAMGIKPGDEVITTPFTFFATAETIAAVGAVPVFVDVDLRTFNIDVNKIEEKITNRTKAIAPVHIFGQSADMDKINEIAKKHNLLVIEDACQAIGAEYKGKKIGTLGDVACFSFFPTKNLGCAGDGGIIVTNNDKIAKIAKGLRTHGSGVAGKEAYELLTGTKEEDIEQSTSNETVYNPAKYYNYMIGYNSRLDELQAAILRIKLREIDKWNNLRAEHAAYYNKGLKDTELIKPYRLEDTKHVYHMYILQSEKRSELLKHLGENKIATGVYYPVPLHLQKAFKNLGYKLGDMPNAEYLSQRTFAIPMYPELTKEQQDYVIEKVKEFK
ncbi:dTDP-4-amino-4,6-dideoxygalactose transaminase [Clostridium cavendishii DSM 21758]|uniref:dTDP-4-amino-4,6-dideoxygalactose transaminase n=1 Tax=Clostridium cavendishii DSM 21758 TaxID=1121302 RepID=A0A1M6Q608_9CLOT|nr:DegT/DnrJ/EryC1/StrS family aminotransferase [Clostridium cavendishii]SHK15719.1 dTDP-4-amino-4,6-dideoxygalactose transaminase [Clostridium cavendishii DSM 21758]